MNSSRTKALLVKYVNQNISKQEMFELDLLLNAVPNEQLVSILQEINQIEEDNQTTTNNDSELASRMDQIFLKIKESTQQLEEKAPRPISKIKRFDFLKYAAILLAALTIAILWQQSKNNTTANIAEHLDVLPAKNIAIVKIGDNHTLQIDSNKTGLIYKDDKLQVYKLPSGEIEYKTTDPGTQAPQFITVNTPKAGFTKVKLNDGTIVDLNANSSITYPIHFLEDLREVRVEGELFFKVKPNKEAPFRVISPNQHLEVLGTSFNLNTKNGMDRTALVEGAVKITAKNQTVLLKPGEEAVVTDKIYAEGVALREKTAWANALFVFDNTPFIDILKQIEDWYDIKFIVEEKIDLNIRLVGEVSRTIKLSELLKVLELNTNYNFEIKERRVIVKKHT